jgi:phage major head subunit gpT-like protein
MNITLPNLRMLSQGYNAAFNTGMTSAPPKWNNVAMLVPSVSAENVYTWLADTFSIREWIGEREYQNLIAYAYTIRNRDFEGTVRVAKNDIADDQYGSYARKFEQMGSAVTQFPDKLVFQLIKDGFTKTCFDGQFFFDTDHPLGKPGQQTFVSNFMGGAGAAWYLVDSKQSMKPIIFQEREKFNLVSRFNPEDPAVFDRKEFIYGVDGRCNAGYGMWQYMFASKQTLDLANVKLAISAMRSQKKDNGEPLEIEPDTIVVRLEDKETAMDLFSKELIANETNTLRNRLNVVASGYLS